MEEEGIEEMMWKTSSSLEEESESMVSATVGRVMSNLLGARPRKLQDAISRLHSAPKGGPIGVSLEQSLWFLHKYVGDAAEKEESLDQILIPMIEHSLKYKESKHSRQAMVLLNWLFQDELLFQALATKFTSIVLRKEDHFIALGWCTLARFLVEYETRMNLLTTDGIQENYNALLRILCSCITHLVSIACNGSTLQGGFELPTRLSVAAADCVLALMVALTRKDLVSHNSDKMKKSSNPSSTNLPITLVTSAISEKKVMPINKSSLVPDSMEMKSMLWDHLDELIILVEKLIAWSRKSRSLHAKGLERLLKWLQMTKQKYCCCQNEAGSQMIKTGVLLLSSCWKHYGMLLHLENCKFSQHSIQLLNQYLSGIQFYAENHAEDYTENKDSGIETIKFFLNCLMLLLGHFDSKQFKSAISEYGLEISRALISQLRCSDDDVIDGAVCILKAVIFKTNYSLPGSSVSDTKQMDDVLPLLLNLLDDRDGATRAIVKLLAEYCSMNLDSWCLEEVLKLLASGNVLQRRNAIDVVSELIHISLDSENALSHPMWQDIGKHLLERLKDEELVIQVQASSLISMIDPSLVLPALVCLIYSSDENVQSSASNTLIAVLKYHNQKSDIICKMLDCLSNFCQSLDVQKTAGDQREASKVDADRVLKLIPEWSKTVEDWNLLIGPLIDKMFAEPSNATIVRFLSYISEQLAEAADLVLCQLLLHTRRQKEIDESFFEQWERGSHTNSDSMELQHSLFDRLCPLLIIRLLPLRVFNDLNSSLMYDNGHLKINDTKCVAALLLNRAFNKFEFEDVRKLAAELCGRIHPQVLFPIISSELDSAVIAHDVLKIKACLFTICTSLVVRGRDSILHPFIIRIRRGIEAVLSWPSIDSDEVSKAQHGCIDCLALIVCAELQAPQSFKVSSSDETSMIVKKAGSGDSTMRNSVQTYVIHQLTGDKTEFVSSKSGRENSTFEAAIPLSFRLCMANVLISACQKISSSGKKPLAQQTIPHLIHSVGLIKEAEIRAACVQILFSAVYHLKSAVLPYSSDILKVSLKLLRQGSEKERIAGAKLLAALMASEEPIVESISGGLLEARTLLSSISLSDSSSDLQEMCKKLFLCMTSP